MMKEQRRNARRGRGWLIAGLILLILTAAGAVYMADYYRADDIAVELTQQAPLSGGAYLFGTGDRETGILFYPGAKVDEAAYAPMLQTVADTCCADCYLVSMPARFALLGIDRAADVMAANPQVKTWVLMGHSLGGVVGGMFTAKTPAVRGLILLAGYTTDPQTAPVLSVYGSEDGVLNRAEYQKALRGVQPLLTERVIEGANHSGFGFYGPQKGDGKASITPEEQQQALSEIILDFLTANELN